MNTTEHFEEWVKCQSLFESHEQTNDASLSCSPNFDGVLCWPSTAVRSLAEIPCFLPDKESGVVTRWCAANTSEITGLNVTVAEWQAPEYGGCSYAAGRFNFSTVKRLSVENDSYLLWWHYNLNYVDRVGYSASITALLLALIIFLTFNQLQDTRVKVHINMFSAMLLESISCLVQNILFGCQMYYTMLINESAYEGEHSIICKTLLTVTNYFELSMFMWLLIEGWFFYCFVSLSPYKNYTSIKPQMLVGWGFPFVIIIPWIIIHLYYPTNFCWIDMDAKINIMAVPVFIIILINLCLYILNIRTLFLKMRNTVSSDREINYWKWIKASLMLMPLFGTYDFLYGISPWLKGKVCKVYFLLVIKFICSFKGFVVALLYCFANNHVKNELRRAWNTWKLKREVYSEQSKRRSESGESSNSSTDSRSYIGQKF